MEPTVQEFQAFPKIPCFSREVIVTEKIDGTNASVWISDDGTEIRAASRTRFITPEADNFGFAKWVAEHRAELLKLGPGSHFGEWWGPGIQRGYGQAEKRFSLFNVAKWTDDAVRPACCYAVPVLWRGLLDALPLAQILEGLRVMGSVVSPGFMRPEGVVIYHRAAGALFKKTLEKDEGGKSE